MNTKHENSKEKVQMETLSSCLSTLNGLGFETQFKATPEGLLSLTTQRMFQPTEIKAVHFYRFEGESNPSDNSIVYALESSNGERGTLVDGYGTKSDSNVTQFMQNVKEIHK